MNQYKEILERLQKLEEHYDNHSHIGHSKPSVSWLDTEPTCTRCWRRHNRDTNYCYVDAFYKELDSGK